MHNGMLRFTGEKMSKSVGNVVTIQEALERWGRETMLLFFLTAHWRRPIDFSDETMEQAGRAWRRSARHSASVASRPAPAPGSASRRRSTTTSTRRTRSPCCTNGGEREHELLGAGSTLFGLASPRRARRPPRCVELARAAPGGPREARDFAEADRLRGEIEARAGRSATSRTATALVRRR